MKTITQKLLLIIFLISIACSQIVFREEHDHDHDHEHNENFPNNTMLLIFDYFKANDSSTNNETISESEFEILYDTLFPNETEDSHGHNHKRIFINFFMRTVSKKRANETFQEFKECFTMDEIYHNFDANEDEELDFEEFTNASSVLFLMKLKNCPIENKKACVKPSTAKKWGFAVLANSIMVIISLIGIVILILTRFPKVEALLSSVLFSFAIGTLFGDASLHIIPEILGVHDPAEALSGKNYLWLIVVIFATIIFFFSIERVFFLYHEHKGIEMHDHHHEFPEEITLSENKENNDEKEKENDTKKVKVYGWLSIIADSIHNFTDGIALGIAFSDSLSLGLTTSIAVGAHEIPSEIAEFKILVSSGLSIGKALFYNFISALVSFVGLFIGLGAGTASREANRWFLAFTAGGFIYISLISMLPSMLKKKGIVHFALQLFGLFLGFFILFIIAWFEKHSDPCV